MGDKGVTAVLLLSCRDQKGLVAAVSDFLYRNDGNIVHADQHTDPRRASSSSASSGSSTASASRARTSPTRSGRSPSASHDGWDLRFSDEVPRMAILVSKLQHCLYDLLCPLAALGDLHAEIPLVISNHPDLQSDRRAASASSSTACP